MAAADVVAPAGRVGGIGARRLFRSLGLLDRFGVVVFGMLILVAIFAPMIAPYDPVTPAGPPLTPQVATSCSVPIRSASTSSPE